MKVLIYLSIVGSYAEAWDFSIGLVSDINFTITMLTCFFSDTNMEVHWKPPSSAVKNKI